MCGPMLSALSVAAVSEKVKEGGSAFYSIRYIAGERADPAVCLFHYRRSVGLSLSVCFPLCLFVYLPLSVPLLVLLRSPLFFPLASILSLLWQAQHGSMPQ